MKEFSVAIGGIVAGMLRASKAPPGCIAGELVLKEGVSLAAVHEHIRDGNVLTLLALNRRRLTVGPEIQVLGSEITISGGARQRTKVHVKLVRKENGLRHDDISRLLADVRRRYGAGRSPSEGFTLTPEQLREWKRKR